MTPRVSIGLLGPTTLTTAARATSLSPAQRRLVAALVLAGGAGASPERLVAAVWGDDPPRSARASLHNQLARLRRLLPADTIGWDDRRYRLRTSHVDIDVIRFARACAATGVAAEAGEVATVLRHAQDALRLWRGEPFEDLRSDDDHLDTERLRLEELHAEVEDARARALLGAGKLPAAITELQELVRTAPHREQRWSDLMTALTRAGRRAEALEAYESARQYFVGELGLEPPVALSRLHLAVLRLEPSVTDDPVTRRPAPVVGRDTVVAQIDHRLDRDRVVVLTGEAGIGKSSVVEELAARHQRAGRRTVTVTCAANPWSALQPLVDLLDQLHDDLDRLDPPPGPSVRGLLGGDPVGPSTSVLGSDPGVLHDEVADVLGRLGCDVGGLTVVLDDAHRGGPTTHRLLRSALDRGTSVRLLAVARDAGDLPPVATERTEPLELGPLGLDAISDLVRRRFDHEVDSSELVSWLARTTGGNALFVTALLDDLTRRGALAAADGRIRPPRTLEVPDHLQETIAAAIEVLGLRTRRALDVAAVLDEPIEEQALRTLTDPTDLAPAVDAGVLRPTSATSWVFRHELVRRVAYELVPTGRRVELHHAVATAGPELGIAPPQVAGHALAAAALDPSGAVVAARGAAEAALEAVTYEEAAAWFDRAATVGGTIPLDASQLLWLEVEAADAQRLAGVPGHADRLLDAAERAVDGDDADLRRRAVLASLQLGETGEPGPLQQRAATLATAALEREDDPAGRAAISASASLVHSLGGEPDRCRQLFTDALELLEDDDPVTAVQVLPFAYLGLARADELDRRAWATERLHHDAVALDDPAGMWESDHLAFTVALQRGDGEQLRAAHQRMKALRDRVGDAGRRWSLAYQDAAIHHLDGDLGRAEVAAEQALSIGAGVAASRAFAAYAGQLLELRRQAGRLEELVPVILQLLDQQEALPAWRAAATLVLAGTDPERSAALADELGGRDGGFTSVPHDFTWLASMLLLARAAVVRGDVDRARIAAAPLRPYADRVSWQGTCSYGPVALTLAQVDALAGDHDAAAAYARAAADVARRLRAPRYLDEATAVTTTVG